MNDEMLEYLENMNFYKPSDDLAKKITIELRKSQLEDYQNLEDADSEYDSENLAEEITLLEEKHLGNQTGVAADNGGSEEDFRIVDPLPLQRYLQGEIYSYLGYLAQNMRNPKKPLPAKRVIVEEMPKILGLRKDDALVVELARDFASWIQNNTFQADWGFVSGDDEGNICLLCERAVAVASRSEKIDHRKTTSKPPSATGAVSAPMNVKGFGNQKDDSSAGLLKYVFNTIFKLSGRHH